MIESVLARMFSDLELQRSREPWRLRNGFNIQLKIKSKLKSVHSLQVKHNYMLIEHAEGEDIVLFITLVPKVL